MSQLITINLSKGSGTPWGFRLQGGKDFAQPLCIQKVNVGSVAESAGLQAGDAIVSIGSSDALTLRHKEAQDTIVKAGNCFPMVVQRGAMTWRPQVTALSQPKKTPEGPVITQTSLAATGKQHTKNSPRLNIGSSHNYSPRPFPGSGNWATTSTNTTPLQSPIQQTPSYHYDTPTNSDVKSHSLSKSSSTTTTNDLTHTETLSETRSMARSSSRGEMRGISQSPSPHGVERNQNSLISSQSSYAKRRTNESVNETKEESFKSTSSYSMNLVNNTRLCMSTSNLLSQMSLKEDVSDNSIHHAAFVANTDHDGNCASPTFPSSPHKLNQSPRVSSPTLPMRTPSPSYYTTSTPNTTHANTITLSARSNRSPSPYYISNNSRTPRSLSPSCSIPSLHSGSSVCGSPTARTSQLHDPVSDLDTKNSLKIAGADIALDKENARNFLKMQLEKERGKDFSGLYTQSGTRRMSRTTSKDNYSEEHQETCKTAYNEDSRNRKFSHDSRWAYRNDTDVVDSPFKGSTIRNTFKSTDNLYMEANPANLSSTNNNNFATNCTSNGSVTDNIRRFNTGRRHSTCVPPYTSKRDHKYQTLDRNFNVTNYRTPTGDNFKRFQNLNSQGSESGTTTPPPPSSNRWGGSAPIRRTAYTGSCSNLASNSNNNVGLYSPGTCSNLASNSNSNVGLYSPGTNCNVPWRNHFSNLRRKSVSALIRGPGEPRLSTPDAPDNPQQRAPKGFNAVPAGFGEVNGQPIVNPQYNSPINLYNEESIAEALSAQSEVLGQGCLGINFRKFDREVKLQTNSPTYQMIHGDQGDAAPKTRKQLPPQEEIPQQPKPLFPAPQPGQPGAGSSVSSPVPGSGPSAGTCPTRSVQAPVTKPRAEGDPQVGGATICSQCERPIIGVFVRIKDKNLHADCFKCNTCGSSLKNVGYYNISDKLYCDVHAKQAAKHNPPGPNMVPITVPPGAVPPIGAVKAPFSAAPAQQELEPEPVTPVHEEPLQETAAPDASEPPSSEETQLPQEPPALESPLPSSPIVEEQPAPVVHEAPVAFTDPLPEQPTAAPEETAVVEAPPTPTATEEQTQQQEPAALEAAEPAVEEAVTVDTKEHEPVQDSVPEKIVAVEESIPAEPEAQEQPAEETVEIGPESLQPDVEPEAVPELQPESATVHPETETQPEPVIEPQPTEPEPELVPEPEPEILEAPPPVEDVGLTREEPLSLPAAPLAPAPAPIPTHYPAAPAPSAVASGGSSANPQAFGAPAGSINVRSHIPKKGPVAPAPIVPAPIQAPAPVFSAPKPAPAPVAAPVSISAAPAPAPAPMFGGGGDGGGMPKPAPPPGMGGLAKPPGIGGLPTKGIPGERTAPKRGRGVMTAANVSRVPMCANCQRQIRGPFVTALGKNWCPDHFHCATEACRKPLIELGFVEEKGSLYCEDCYEKFLAPTCGKCDKRIKGDCLNAVGKQFHPECFACAYCGKVFGSGAFYLEDGLPYCETDWNDLFTTKCVGCGFPIEAGDRWVEALNNNYHSQCFKCSKCHKNLEGQSFFAKGGKPFCKAHAQRGF